MDAVGTITWMESVESSREQRPRATHGSREGEDRVKQDARTEDQLPRNGYRYYLQGCSVS